MQSSMTQQFMRQRACGLQKLQHAAPASYKAARLQRATFARSTKTAQQQVQEQKQRAQPDLQHLQEQQPKAVALQAPSRATQALMAALPQPVQRGLRAAATALQPARQAVSGLLGKIDPRVRGLILLNAMTVLMGSNWVVVKGANDAWDPVSTAARLARWFGCLCAHYATCRPRLILADGIRGSQL